MSMQFPEVKKKLGFGCMRLPMAGDEVDEAEFCRMIDAYLAAGFNYFDTAHGYLDGRSEKAVRRCLVDRYPRESYLLADKLTAHFFNDEKDVRPFFESQLSICGVDCFDFYLMHAQSKQNFPKFKKCRAYEQAFALKEEGKIRHVGLSFHDTAEMLDEILTTYPDVEFVQLQLNYLDWDDPAVQSRRCYEVARRHNKPVAVMEPVKGGSLANLPPDAAALLRARENGSPASYAIRFAAGFDGVFTVLSGMSDLTQLTDNLSYMTDLHPLTKEEEAAVYEVRRILTALHTIPCTACRYCTSDCPAHISIPDLFACLNAKNVTHDWNAAYYYHEVYTKAGGRASDCRACGKCEKVCPQHLPVRDLLREVAREFDS